MEAGTACAIDKQLMRDAVANVSSGRMRPHQFLKSIREHQASINVSLELAYYTASASHAASNLSVVEGRRYRTPEWRDHNHISGHGALPRIVNDHLRARGELSDKLMESTLLDKSRVLAGDATFKVATLMRVDSGKSGVFSNVYTLMAGDGGEAMLLYRTCTPVAFPCNHTPVIRGSFDSHKDCSCFLPGAQPFYLSIAVCHRVWQRLCRTSRRWLSA